MGIVRGSARLMLDEARRRPFSGSVLELGRMAVFFRHDELRSWAKSQRVELAPAGELTLSHEPRLAAQGCLSDASFFRLLGFDSAVSADVSDYEGADVIWDLNQPAPPELRERFDVVFEGGTIQHIFDLKQVFTNIHDVLKPGGRVIHAMSPSNNHVDHGFYMFSPTLFADVYSAYGYDIEALYLFDFVPFWYRGRFFSSPFRVYRYEPGSLDHLSYGRWGNHQTSLFVVATKKPGASAARTPQQGQYRAIWRQDHEDSSAPPVPPKAERAYKHAPYLVLGWKYLRELGLRYLPKKKPPTIARY